MAEDILPVETDLYAVLGVDRHASTEEIRAAYRALAQRFHPDHNPNNIAAQKRMQEINEAFAVLNAPERRREYDQRRAERSHPAETEPSHGAGRSPRPYFRGNNWGVQAGGDAPPEHIVRVSPAGFNLVVTPADQSPSREVTVYNDAPAPVRMRVLCSSWLAASEDVLTVDGGGTAQLTIYIPAEIGRGMRGWRDGGVSLATNDPRVFSPDIRVTAIFLNAPSQVRHSQDGSHAAGQDLRDADSRGEAGEEAPVEALARGWLRRLFGG
jgi:hypothetical protein